MGFGETAPLGEAFAASRVELILKPLVAALQPIPLVLRTPQCVARTPPAAGRSATHAADTNYSYEILIPDQITA